MKKWLALSLAATLVLSTLLTGCSGAKKGTSSDASDKIVIGGALCQTGIQAPLDAPALEGAQIAVDELNAAGGILGKKVEFINIDGKSDAVAVGEAAKQLVGKKAAAIVAPSDFDFGGPASREAQNAGIVGISPCASSPMYGSAALGDKQFTLSMWNTTMGAATAEYAYNTLGLRSVYVVTDDFIDYTKSLSRYFIIRFKELGGTVVREDPYTQGKADGSAFLARYKSFAQKPDAIYVSSYMPDLALLIRTFRENGITVPVFGGDSYDDPALFEALGPKYANDIYYDTHSYLDEKVVPGYEKFAAAYKAKFNKDLEAPWAMAGYDTVMVLAKSMEAAGTTEGAAVAKAMEDGTFDCLTGKLDWSDAASGHEPNKATVLVKVTGAKTESLGWVTPEKIPAP